MAVARRNNVRIALTVSDVWIVEQSRDEFWELIQGPVDLLFCNWDEARSLTGQQDPGECAAAIHEHGTNVALTLGADGSLLMYDGHTIAVESVPTKAIDTTGAGDMYAAGLLYGITNGLSWEQAGRLASHAAARVVAQLGARIRQPWTQQQIAELIR